MTIPVRRSDPLHIAWDVDPPPPDRRKVDVWNPKPGNPVVVRVLSERLTRVFTHYLPDQKATVPCEGEENACEYCRAMGNRRWQGWLAGLVPSTGRYVLVPVSTEAVRGCPVLLNPAVQLRGGVLTLKRRGDSRNSPVSASFQSGRPESLAALPAPFDVQRQLMILWGLRGLLIPLTDAPDPDLYARIREKCAKKKES